MATKPTKPILVKINSVPETLSTYRGTDTLYFLMGLHGFMKPKKFQFLHCIKISLVFFFGTIFLPCGLIMLFFKMEDPLGNLGLMFMVLETACNASGGTLKLLYLRFMFKKLDSTRKIIAKLDARCIDTDDIIEQNNVIKICQKIPWCFASAYLFYSASAFIGGILTDQPPVGLYLPYIDWRKSRFEFWIVVFVDYLSLNCASIQQGLNDSYATVFVRLLISHLRIIKRRISKLGSKSELSQHDNVNALKMCIKDHKALLELHETIGPIISMTTFIQFSITAVMISATLTSLTLFATEFYDQVKYLSYFAGVLVQLFPICFYAQRLQFESDDLCNQIFHSQWVYQNKEYRKTLIYFMQKSQCSIQFTAGKLFPIALNSFISIMKFSFSLYTLIEQMDLKTKLGLQ